VYVRDVRIREPNDDFQHEYELIRTAAEKAGKSDINEATIAHAEALAHTASLASLEGNLVALIRIWSELDEEMEGWIRSEMAILAEEYRDRQLLPKKYAKIKRQKKKALKKQMLLDRKAENAKKKLELKELKRKLQEEQLEREKNGVGVKDTGIPHDLFWPLESKEDWSKKAPSSNGSKSGSDDDLYTDAEDEEEEDEPENDAEREELRLEKEAKERRLARKAIKAAELAAKQAAAAALLAVPEATPDVPLEAPPILPAAVQGASSNIPREIPSTTSRAVTLETLPEDPPEAPQETRRNVRPEMEFEGMEDYNDDVHQAMLARMLEDDVILRYHTIEWVAPGTSMDFPRMDPAEEYCPDLEPDDGVLEQLGESSGGA